MRIFIVIDETVFFHPEFLQNFIGRTKDDLVGACLVTKIKKKNNIEKYMVSHFYYLRPMEIMKLGWRQVKYLCLDKLNGKKRPHTVRRVLENNHISYKEVHFDINTEDNLAYIRRAMPDVIISSQSLYFGKKLLGIPNICCINRHSGLLPKNGGLWPGFQAVRKGETETGVSIHTMEKEIDGGRILSQVAVPIHEGESVWDIYKECFSRSTDVLLEALDKIRDNDFSVINNGYSREYYSFPTKEHWKEFRRRGGIYV